MKLLEEVATKHGLTKLVDKLIFNKYFPNCEGIIFNSLSVETNNSTYNLSYSIDSIDIIFTFSQIDYSLFQLINFNIYHNPFQDYNDFFYITLFSEAFNEMDNINLSFALPSSRLLFLSNQY